MKKKWFFLIILVFIGSFAACRAVAIDADYPTYDSAQDLVDQADLIFSGRLEEISYEVLDVRTEKEKDSEVGLSESQGLPYTIYKIRVEEIYKGSSDETYISIKCLGGEVNNVEYVSEEKIVLKEDTSYLFLTKTYENTYPSLLNITQSTYDMNNPSMVSEEVDITLSDILGILQ